MYTMYTVRQIQLRSLTSLEASHVWLNAAYTLIGRMDEAKNAHKALGNDYGGQNSPTRQALSDLIGVITE